MKDVEAREFARAAMRHWGVEDEPRLIKNRENAVFETRTAEGARAALRLHRPGYQSDDSIRSELWWSEALVAAVDHGPQAPSIAAARMAATCGVGLQSGFQSPEPRQAWVVLALEEDRAPSIVAGAVQASSVVSQLSLDFARLGKRRPGP